MNFEQARFNMVEQQIRSSAVLDQEVLDVLMAVRREQFVPAAHKALAFAETALPLGHGAAMLMPVLEGRILQALQVRKSDRILEVGTGSGHLAALLAARGEHVTSIEIEPELAALARANLERADVDNVTVEVGDGAQGWPARAPYDVIVLSGTVPELPDALIAQLKPGGRLLAFVGERPLVQAQLVTCAAEGRVERTGLFETDLPDLRNAPARSRFAF